MLVPLANKTTMQAPHGKNAAGIHEKERLLGVTEASGHLFSLARAVAIGCVLTLAPAEGQERPVSETRSEAEAFIDAPLTTARACTGDCDESGDVTVDEILIGISIALGQGSATACSPLDSNLDGLVTVDEIVVAVTHALIGCRRDTSATEQLGAIAGSIEVVRGIGIVDYGRIGARPRGLGLNVRCSDGGEVELDCSAPSQNPTLIFRDCVLCAVPPVIDLLQVPGVLREAIGLVINGTVNQDFLNRPVCLGITEVGDTVVLTIDGSAEFTEAETGLRLTEVYRGTRLETEVLASGVTTAIDGIVSNCLGEVRFTTVEKLFTPPGSSCPTSGTLAVSFSAVEKGVVRYFPDRIELDTNDDGIPEEVTAGCSDPDLLECGREQDPPRVCLQGSACTMCVSDTACDTRVHECQECVANCSARERRRCAPFDFPVECEDGTYGQGLNTICDECMDDTDCDDAFQCRRCVESCPSPPISRCAFSDVLTTCQEDDFEVLY